MNKYIFKTSDNTVFKYLETEVDLPEKDDNGNTIQQIIPSFPGWPTDPSKVLKYKDGRFVLENTEDIVALKAHKSSEINAARLEANKSFVFEGKQISCDELSKAHIESVNGTVCLTGNLPTDFLRAWKAVDNTMVQIPNKSVWMAFHNTMVNQILNNFNHAHELKIQLENATTVEDIEKIMW